MADIWKVPDWTGGAGVEDLTGLSTSSPRVTSSRLQSMASRDTSSSN